MSLNSLGRSFLNSLNNHIMCIYSAKQSAKLTHGTALRFWWKSTLHSRSKTTFAGLSSKSKNRSTPNNTSSCSRTYHSESDISKCRSLYQIPYSTSCGLSKVKKLFTTSCFYLSSKANGKTKDELGRPQKHDEEISAKKNIKGRVGELVEDIKTIPNLLTMSRVVLTPVCGYLVLHGSFNMALGIFVFAGVTDLLDGYIARAFPSQKSVLGSVIDPLADKFLVSVLTVTLTMVNLIPVALTGLIILRDVGLIAGSAYMRYTTLPEPRSFSQFFDISILTFTVQPTAISKVNTSVQLLLLASTLGAPVFGYVDHIYLHYLWYLTAVTTIMSGISYLTAKDAIRLMKKKT